MGNVGQQPLRNVYNLTRTGRARLGNEAASWNRIADAITMALRTTAKEI